MAMMLGLWVAVAATWLRAAEPVRVVCLGDSLTAGYLLESDDAWPRLLEAALVAGGHAVEVINAGVSGDTTAGGLARLGWILRRAPDVLLLGLGGNDALRGLEPTQTRANLAAIIERARAANPQVRILLLGMQAPPNMGAAYARDFAQLFPALAAEAEVALYPFMLEGIAAQPQLNLADGIHPNAQGHAVLAEKLRPVVAALLAAPQH